MQELYALLNEKILKDNIYIRDENEFESMSDVIMFWILYYM